MIQLCTLFVKLMRLNSLFSIYNFVNKVAFALPGTMIEEIGIQQRGLLRYVHYMCCTYAVSAKKSGHFP